MALHRDDRMEPLLMRLADVAADNADGRDDATWALHELLRIKKAAGDLDAAARVLERAADLLPLERVMPLARDLAERAGRAGNLRLGAELLERLRTSAPADESVWRPLLEHYVGLRDRAGLARLVTETLPLLPDVGQRNHLRMALARLQLGEDGADASAAGILQDVLLEEPANAEALGLLAGYYERIGSEGDLVDLLAQAFDTAVASGDPAAVGGSQRCRARGGDVRAGAHRRPGTAGAAQAAAGASPGRGHPRARGADGGGPRRGDRAGGGAPRPRAVSRLGRSRRRRRRAPRAGEGLRPVAR